MDVELVEMKARRSAADEDDSKPVFEAKGHFTWETSLLLARTALVPRWAWIALPTLTAIDIAGGGMLAVWDATLGAAVVGLGGAIGLAWLGLEFVARRRARRRLMQSAGEHHLLFFRRGLVCGCPNGRNQTSWRNIIGIRQVGHVVVLDTTPFRHDVMAWELDPSTSFRRADKTKMTFEEAVAECRTLWEEAMRDPWRPEDAGQQDAGLYS